MVRMVGPQTVKKITIKSVRVNKWNKVQLTVLAFLTIFSVRSPYLLCRFYYR